MTPTESECPYDPMQQIKEHCQDNQEEDRYQPAAKLCVNDGTVTHQVNTQHLYRLNSGAGTQDDSYQHNDLQSVKDQILRIRF